MTADAGPDSYERALTARRRRARVIGLVVAAVVVLGAGGVALYLSTRPPPRCDAKQLEVFLGSTHVPAAAIGEVCKLPAPLTSTLSRMIGLPPELGRLSMLKLVAEHHELFAPKCANFPRAVAGAVTVAPAGQSTLLVDACSPGAFPFADEATLAHAPLDRLLLASAVHTALVDDDASTADRIARALLDR